MTGLHKALQAFWSGFGIPAYVSGHVPANAAYPYITYEVQDGDSFDSTTLTAFCWYEINRNTGDYSETNSARATMLDAIADAIPMGGTNIPVPADNGFCMLYRSTGFESYYDDPADDYVIGGRIAYDITFYKE